MGYVSNTTFNNISVISWQLVLLMEKTRVFTENHQPAVTDKLDHIKVYLLHLGTSGNLTLNFSDCNINFMPQMHISVCIFFNANGVQPQYSNNAVCEFSHKSNGLWNLTWEVLLACDNFFSCDYFSCITLISFSMICQDRCNW